MATEPPVNTTESTGLPLLSLIDINKKIFELLLVVRDVKDFLREPFGKTCPTRAEKSATVLSTKGNEIDVNTVDIRNVYKWE